MNLMVHVGGDPEISTHIVEVVNEQLERLLNVDGSQDDTYVSRSISVVREA